MSDKRKAADSASETVAETDLVKGLDRLERMAKGQITGKLPGNSGPKGRFAYGQEPEEVGDDESDVSSDSGEEERQGKKSDTDYKAKGAPVQKGLDDEAEDDGDADDEEGDDGDEDGDAADPFEGAKDADDKEEDKPPAPKDTDKSFAARARASKHIRSGVEVSPFLRDTIRSINKGFRDHEQRIVRALGREIRKSLRTQRNLFKSIAEVLTGLGAVTLEHGDVLKSLAAQPARGPKSQLHAVRPVQKSFDGGADESVTLPDGSTLPQLSRADVMQRLLAGVSKGLIGSGEVIKFETTGIVHPALYKSLATDERFWK